MNAFDEHCDSGLRTSKYHLHDYMVDDVRSFEMILVPDNSAYERFDVHNMEYIKRVRKRDIQK